MRTLCACVHVVFNLRLSNVSKEKASKSLNCNHIVTSTSLRVLIKTIKIIILAIPAWWILSCSAPHDNPLDPSSPNYVEPDSTPDETPPPGFSTIVRSVHKGRVTTDVYSVKAELWPDSNMFIDSVTVQYKATPPRTMRFMPNGHWFYSFNSTNVGDDDLESAVGEPFFYYVYTPDDSIWNVGPAYFVRVIHETPQTDSPDSNQIVDSYPTLSWPNFGASYPFRYQVFIELTNTYFNAIPDTPWFSDTLSGSALSVTVSDSLIDSKLDSLEYNWTLVVYDNFGNSSISVEAEFQVMAGDTP